MEDPVEPGAHQEHDVGVLQRQCARRRDRQRMVVGHDALAHRRTQERDLRALEEGAHLLLGARPGHALADENERPLGLFEQVQGVLDGAHAAAIGFGLTADQDHRPAILLGIGHAGEAVHDPGAGHDDAGAGAALQIAVGLRGLSIGIG